MNHSSPRKAIAIKYEKAIHNAPVISAKGIGTVAETILSRAVEHGIPIKEDKSLAEILSKLDVNSQIPPELYQVVAEMLAFVYKMDKRVVKPK
jgi:flagellar biosynthesis protein